MNSVTKIVAIPIPSWYEAVGNDFGGEFCWLMDSIYGYNQMIVAKYSQPKLYVLVQTPPNVRTLLFRLYPSTDLLSLSFLLKILTPLGKNLLTIAVFQLRTTLIQKSYSIIYSVGI